ncbi:MAG: Queuosine Biosynthesis QueC ATPase [Candidatus Ozemobacter sibiricus]|uniref:7-cyano-7-deazaguanine synthase n=1 Tax=Candidatus Ozemobacter sibiricus TaxID=2268124 RepID=A0A367ZMK4_9BACT|nr:MAG: Queuosine Biosynthesis QueC ATPase [Candidatus Ozemobacter sibiricus]
MTSPRSPSGSARAATTSPLGRTTSTRRKPASSAQRPLAVIVASGGMDSTVCISIAVDEGFEPALFHLDYGQRTERRERRAFRALARHFGARHTLVVKAAHFRQIGGSALTDHRIAVPTGRAAARATARATAGHGLPVTYVPFRNANILAMAVSWAEVIGATRVYIGAVEEDSSGYPDCRETFIRAFDRAIKAGTGAGHALSLKAPLLHLSKKEIVRWGMSLGTPFHLTWSCYQREDLACGECDSCRLRLRGFRQAGFMDPLPYARNEQG